MSLRSRAREIVLQILYQDDMNKDRSTEEDIPFIKNRLHNNGNIIDFAKELLDGVRDKLSEIDSQLSAVAENWRISRMAATDRNVLRLGAFEILFYETPAKVAINEAIELAKRYGSELSPTFINGILDRLIKSSQTNPDSDDDNSAGKTDPAQATDETATVDSVTDAPVTEESVTEETNASESKDDESNSVESNADESELNHDNESVSTSETSSETDTING